MKKVAPLRLEFHGPQQEGGQVRVIGLFRARARCRTARASVVEPRNIGRGPFRASFALLMLLARLMLLATTPAMLFPRPPRLTAFAHRRLVR